MKVDGDPLLKLLILVVTAAGQGDSPNYRGLKQTELSNYSHYHFCRQVGETCQSPMILSFAKLDIPIDRYEGVVFPFLPPGRKPYPRNTFFWASSCSSLCFDPGVMSILTASVHTSHMLAPWKRSCSKCYAMHWMSLHTSHMLAPWKHSCSKCYGMDCLGTYLTHAQT